MKVVFAQRIWRELLGTMSLSASLRLDGHHAHVAIAPTVPALVREVLARRPDAVAVPWNSDDHRFNVRLVRTLKAARPGLPVIGGGPHPTHAPEVIDAAPLDAICRGDGEDALREWVAARARGGDGAGIANLWVRTPGGLVRAELRRAVEDLDDLPDPDRDLYMEHRLLRTNPHKPFMAGRGCPHGCTFCATPSLRRLYRGRGRILRWRSPARVVAEIERVRDRWGLRSARFEDDTFSQDPAWLAEFLPAYRRRVGLPFVCYVRADQVTDDLARRLREAGCSTVCFGVESGDEDLRNRLLGKHLRDDELLAAAERLRAAGVRFYTTNMFGLPGETLEQGWRTVHLNRRLRPDTVWSSVFQPYPGLPLTDRAVREGRVTPEEVAGVITRPFAGNVLRQPDARALFALHLWFPALVRFPALEPFVRARLAAGPGAVDRLVFLASYAASAARRSGIDPVRLAWEGAHWLRFFGSRES